MNNVKAHIPRSGHAHYGIQIRSIVVQEGPTCMHHRRYLENVLLEQSQGVWVGQHQGGCCFIKLGGEVLQIDHALLIAGYRNHIKAIYRCTRRIRPMSADGNENLGALTLSVLDEVGANHLQACVLSMSPCTRLKRSPAHSCDRRKVLDQVVHH
ncbi:hypothetical protein SDC9_49158 [bioreactor metagenome]|uniref:Uncharacterized protein n=1 Tax=bioreactor metagenome TaxID=1076179 RepID=A0A644WGM0_9ZZZZ